MDVIKKSDVLEKFSYEKLTHSILVANAETGEELDVQLLVAEFQNIVADMEQITTGQINVIVYGLLYAKNALKTLENSSGYKKYD